MAGANRRFWLGDCSSLAEIDALLFGRERRERDGCEEQGNHENSPSRLLKKGVRPQPLAAAGSSLAAREERRNDVIRMFSRGARCEKPDATPASIFQQPARPLP